MARLTANSAFDINNFNLNYYVASYASEQMIDDVFNPWEDNYFIFTTFDDALSMGGTGFGYDINNLPTFGTMQTLGEWSMVAGTWQEHYGVTGLNLAMSDFVSAILTQSNVDDLALVKQQLSGGDKIFLSDFDDVMYGYNGSDRIYGYGGNDNIKGGNGKDKLFGGDNKDVLRGGDGDDILRGGQGRDKEIGGGGEDIFRFKTGDDRSTIMDFDAKGAVHDIVDLGGLKSVKSWSDLKNNHMVKDGADVVIDGGNGDVIVLKDVSMSSLDKGDFLF